MPLPLIGRRPSLCERVAPMLPAFAAREADLDGAVADHVGHCLRCQAEVARYRRMLRTLRSLRADTAPAPPEILSRLLDDVDEASGAPPLVVAVLVSVGAVLGATAALAWTHRGTLLERRPGPWPAG